MKQFSLKLEALPADAGTFITTMHGRVKLSDDHAHLVLYLEDPEAELKDLVQQLENAGFQFPHLREQFGIVGMTCVNCAASASSTLRFLPGVLSAEVSYANASVAVNYLPDLVQAAQMRNALSEIGYQLLIEQDAGSTDQSEAIRAEALRRMARQAKWSMVLAIPLFVLGMFLMDLPGRDWLMCMLATPLLFVLGKHFFINAYRQLRHGRANMDTLVALSTGIAYVSSLYFLITARMAGSIASSHQLFFEASGVVVAFIIMGRYLEEKAKMATSSAIRNMMSLQPNQVTVVQQDGSLTPMPIASVYPGDFLLARPGDQIAVDGIVTSGYSAVEESMLTGESVPVEKQAGDSLIAGTLNTTGTLTYRATKIGKDTLLARMIAAVQQAQGSRAPVERLTDKIASVFVPVVVLIALISFFVWGLVAHSWPMGLHAAITVLVISCPCALGLATPTAIVAAMGRGAELGILIRDAAQLEQLKDIQVLLVDKTGTLTKGHPEVHAIWTHPNLRESDMDTLAAIEQRSEHPLAGALCRYLGKRRKLELTNFSSVPGKGVSADYDGETYYVGNRQWLEDEGVSFVTEYSTEWEARSAEAYSLVWFATKAGVLALVQIGDALKSGSASAVKELQGRGIEVCMLSGDNKKVAGQVAAEVGIRSVQAEMTPKGKADFVRLLQQQGKVVAMAGDGVNDSEALAAADVSIAMDTGSDIAMQLASLTLVQSDLQRIPLAIDLSGRTFRIVRQNLFWAFLYNLIGIPLAAGVFYPILGTMLDPMYAGMAMALSSVSVVLNSLRLRFGKD